MDSRLLPQPGYRLPFHSGGRVLQMLQARSAIRGWITAALPLGGRDDVGLGFILTLFESFLMSLYERGHGAHGEGTCGWVVFEIVYQSLVLLVYLILNLPCILGGARGSVFFTKRYAAGSGLNSSNFDFLPVQNIEEGELDMVVGGVVGAVPVGKYSYLLH